MKKLFSTFIALIIALTPAVGLCASRIPVYRVDGALLFFEKSTGEITGFAGEPTRLSIPTSIAGYKVVSIGNGAFKNCVTLSSVSIPGTVNHIGSEAFAGCTELKTVTFGGFIENVPLDAFDNTPWEQGLDGGFVIAGGTLLLKYSGSDARLTIPYGVQKIAPDAFAGNLALTEVILPEGLVEIGDNAFVHCANLSGIVFPSTLSFVGIGAFDGTAWLTNSPDEFVAVNGILLAYNGEGGCVDVPNGIISLGSGVFMSNDRINAVYLPPSLRTVNEAAFGESKSLKAVIFNSGVEWIDEYAFTGTPGAALIGEKGSYAEYYAQMSGMSFSEPTVVTVNGAGLSADVKPVVIDGVTYAPARAVMEALGLTVGWNDGALTGENEDVRFSARAGESAASLNGKPAELAGPVIYCGGRAMIPLRSIAELLGAKVEWNGETNSVNISV